MYTDHVPRDVMQYDLEHPKCGADWQADYEDFTDMAPIIEVTSAIAEGIPLEEVMKKENWL